MKTFKEAVRKKDFAISAEIYLRPESDAESLRAQAIALRDSVDGLLLTDNQYGQLHMSTTAAASILIDYGVDPIVQLTCRNRNRIALISDLLGVGALGVTSLLLVAGERAPEQFQPRPKPVMDLSATDLIRTAATMKIDEKLTQNLDFFVGGVVTPIMPKPSWEAKQLREKIDAGAQFVQTHICMDVELLRRYLSHLVANKLTQRTSVVASVALLGSVEDERWLRENRPNVMLPDGMAKRLESASNPREEGIQICAETILAMREIPGLAGVNIMSARDLSAIPEVVRAAGLHD